MNRFFGNRLKAKIWQKIEQSSGVLIIGCEGGFNILNALPVFLAIRSMQKPVVLCNMSLSSLKDSQVSIVLRDPGISNSPILYLVSSSSEYTQKGTKEKQYFPEKYLCEWFASKNERILIYCTERTGPKNLSMCYSKICQDNGLDLIIIVDHGSDSLMAGNEKEIGSYLEDFLTMLGTNQTSISSVLCNMVLGVDRHSGVSDCSTWRALSEITEIGGNLGSFSLSRNMTEVHLYLEACQYVEEKMPRPNIPGIFLRSALEGGFGNLNIHPNGERTFINPIMTGLYFSELSAVLKRVKYLDYVEDAKTASEVVSGVDYFRNNLQETIEEEIPRTKEF
jgi:hypothetical protein